jgi:hypothetical protein
MENVQIKYHNITLHFSKDGNFNNIVSGNGIPVWSISRGD